MNREVREAIRTMIFIALLLISTALSTSLTRLRVRNFGQRLASSIAILSDRAADHKVDITLELPPGNYSLIFFGNGSALFSMNGYKVTLDGFPIDLRGEVQGGKSLRITSERRLLQDG